MSMPSSVEHSPSESPQLGPVRPRRLSARRGSITASDPWGEHASVNLNPTRSTSSRLTIVRVPPQAEADDGRRHRRHGSGASVGSSSAKAEPTGRLSFAITSFAPSGSASGRSSPPSPRIRPTTPGSPHRQVLPLPVQHTKLTPEQVVDLARSSCNPRASSTAQTPISPGGPISPVPAPVSFTPLPDSVYLPFLDRPIEVSTLLSTLPTAKLIALLAQTFTTHVSGASSPSPLIGSASPVSSSSTPSTPAPSPNSDPKTWTFTQLTAWLRTVDRDVADDVTWVRKARACILEHSELIWERLKGALGVPPELNVDDHELPFHIQFQERLKKYRLDNPDADPSSAFDSAVFEPDSPVISTIGVDSGVDAGDPTDPDSVTVSPVLASNVPLPTNTNALQEVLEEEEETADEENGDKAKGGNSGKELRGLRFSTSPSVPIVQSAAGSPVVSYPTTPHNPRSNSFGSSSVRSFVLDDTEYDPIRERGPGRPLFPSSFAHLGTGTLLKLRTQSLSHSSSATAPLKRTGSLGHTSRSHAIPIAGAGRWSGVPDWKNPSNEYAVSTGSASAVE